MGVASDGSYGMPEGLISGFPCTCLPGQWSIVEGLELDEFSRARIDASVNELQEERTAVQELGLSESEPAPNHPKNSPGVLGRRGCCQTSGVYPSVYVICLSGANRDLA